MLDFSCAASTSAKQFLQKRGVLLWMLHFVPGSHGDHVLVFGHRLHRERVRIKEGVIASFGSCWVRAFLVLLYQSI